MRAVSGPCTVNLISADLEARPQWIAMEYVPGPTLQEALTAEGPLPPDRARLFAWALAEAVADVHRAGVIHRDIKPGNVILGMDGPRLLDFGIARSLEASSVTQLGERPGSLGWMTPEQLRGTEQGTFTDVHAWGAVVYVAATGEPPFGSGNAEALAWRIEHVKPRDEPLRRAVPAIADVVLQALAVDPSNRPSVGDLIAATRSFVDPDVTTVPGRNDIRSALKAYWVAPDRSPHQMTPQHDPELFGEHSRARQARRRRRTLGGAIATLVILLGVGGASLLRERSASAGSVASQSTPSGADGASALATGVAGTGSGDSQPSPSIAGSNPVEPPDVMGVERKPCDPEGSVVWAIGATSCEFAFEVAADYYVASAKGENGTEGPAKLADVYSPATGGVYTMYCRREYGSAYCRGGEDATVKIAWPKPTAGADPYGTADPFSTASSSLGALPDATRTGPT